ncbi:hypothetical protein PHSC3_000984 [Chlamydiales bacterium STE3]|nr:hypothetical protein PHSC3_000984 [Chlamydiales bacterium STE3]
MKLTDKVLLRKRAIIETVNDQLKDLSLIEHTRHRSAANFLINLLAGISVYSHRTTYHFIDYSCGHDIQLFH